MKRVYYCVMVTLLSILSGCSLSTYIPTAINVPLLREENEVNLSGGLTANAMSAQVAYSPLANVGVLLNINTNKLSNQQLKSLYFDRHFSGQLGAGYYYPFGNGTVIEGYAGYGYCSSDIRETSFSEKEWISTNEMRGKYNTLFVLQNYGVRVDSMADAVFSVRLTKIAYHEYITRRSTSNSRLSAMIVEPGISMKYGRPSFKFLVQMTRQIPLQTNTVFAVDPFVVSLGIEVLFPIRK